MRGHSHVLRLASGDYLVIGRIAGVADNLYRVMHRHGVAPGLDEIAVVVPADTMRAAAEEIKRTYENRTAVTTGHEEPST